MITEIETDRIKALNTLLKMFEVKAFVTVEKNELSPDLYVLSGCDRWDNVVVRWRNVDLALIEARANEIITNRQNGK
jgi:hypothetical protein